MEESRCSSDPQMGLGPCVTRSCADWDQGLCCAHMVPPQFFAVLQSSKIEGMVRDLSPERGKAKPWVSQQGWAQTPSLLTHP